MNTTDNTRRSKILKIAAVLLVLLVAAGAAWCSYLRYWGPDSWKYGFDEAARGQDDLGNPWIGAEKPELTIEEYMDYECPHCPMAHKDLRVEIGSDLDRVRLVRHDYARMACKPNSSQKRRSSCLLVRAGICAQKEGKFWDWNDAVIADPRPLSGKERKDYVATVAGKLGLDAKALDECMYSEETIDRAQEIYRDAKKRRVIETPTYFVDGEKIPVEEIFHLLDRRL